jgi:drug/metabolite transporter (DMT)-like permease
MDAVTVGMLRTVIAAVILFPLALLLRFPIPRDRECWIAVIVSALAGFVGFTLLFTVGQKFTSTAHAALILASAPIFTGFIGFAVERKWARSIWWVGAIIALVGEGILITYRTPGLVKDATLAGDLLVLVSVLFVSAGYVTGGRSSSKIGAWPTTAWSISLAGLLLAPGLLWRLDTIHFAPLYSDLTSWLAVLYLAVFTSIVGYAAWYGGIGRAGVARISPIQFGQPVVSLAIAVAVVGETITAPILIAVLVILVGLAITRKSNER